MPTTDLEIILYPELFDERRRDVLRTGEWIVTAWRYSTGIAALRISNSRGYIEALPFMGQICGMPCLTVNLYEWTICSICQCRPGRSSRRMGASPSTPVCWRRDARPQRTITHYMESFPVHQCARQVLLQGTNPVALLPSHCPVNMSTA